MADVVVAGALAQRPGRPGHAWVFLNWMCGARRTRRDVVFVDRWTGELGPCAAGVEWVRTVMASADFDGAWAVVLPSGECAGLSRAELERRLDGSVLLNVMGYLDDEALLALPARRIFLDIDPGFGQAWHVAGLADVFRGHERTATVGLNVGRAGCGVPDLGKDWITTVPPVDVDAWSCAGPPRGPLTSVGSWRGPFAPVVIDGVTHGLRVHAGRAFADLPLRTGVGIEVALDIDPADDPDRLQMLAGGWSVREPGDVAGTMDDYRSYLRRSAGEFSIAKEAYVTMRSGWFSDRSACYLASGRPVITTDTGLGGHLPIGDGLLTYQTVDDAVAAIDEVMSRPAHHARAARELALEYLDSRRVVPSLLERAA